MKAASRGRTPRMPGVALAPGPGMFARALSTGRYRQSPQATNAPQ